ncbi:hypothetical protein PROFUN_10250 [Planoprotostelium fungivorum]|uniref:Uncharacterized protein n=1 Tax=Planoprotostelium fungivorum TaxID=1890364 RepID=A0A2P6NEG1_9EUKA|nr:hypothetical protein PROFUN_10250 [Planoprotostelium fungivorum]
MTDQAHQLDDESHPVDLMNIKCLHTMKDEESDKREAAHTLQKLKEEYKSEKKERVEMTVGHLFVTER